MPSYSLRRFANPKVLQSVSPRVLLEFLKPHADYIASKGFDLPQCDAAISDFDYAVIACRLAEIHSQDTGFEPPDKMSKIFRAGDERSKLIKSMKRGYFRLNI